MPKKLTKEKFTERARKVHGNKYDYSFVEYVNNSTKVKIICPTHGEFEQRPNNHLKGQGCKKCSIKKQTKTTQQFIIDAWCKHGDTYNYSLVQYKNRNTKIKI